jgi:mono/diheme cytochrome c family protein
MKKLLSLIILTSLTMASCTTTEIPLDEVSDPIIELVTYTGDVKAIIDNNCIGCHGTTNPSAGLSLVTYQQVRNSAENGNLIARMNNPTNPMTQGGLLSANTRAIIDAWADDGFLEN